MWSNIGDWLGLAFLVGIVYILVRPRSKGAALVEGFATFANAAVRQAAGLAYA